MPQSFAEHLKSFPLSPNLGQSLERAHGFAREQSHKLVTLEHLLLALTEDPEAVIIMQSANVDLARLTTNVSDHLGRLMEDMRADGAVEPRPDPELLRVLQAAATAALQSRRRQIDGAIVLAAVVGDGKSPAAGMLKALGMTFEEAIRCSAPAPGAAEAADQTGGAAYPHNLPPPVAPRRNRPQP
jgi:ATP-dependent Clp protease ATP-binding subunit ClpA